MKRCGLNRLGKLTVPVLACLIAAVACRAAGAAAPKKVTTVEGITEYRLDNGLRVLLFPDSSTSKVTVNMTVFVGSRHEGYGETGMAHLLEHMVFKGTPNNRDVPKALRDHGAEFNGTTWVDRTNYFETLAATDANLEFAIALEADRLVHSFIRREDLASEMTVVRNEFEAGENNPESILSQRMMAAAFEWHNYGKNTIGNRTDIERVPVDRLRTFYRKFYQPDNVMLIVAGKFDPDKALALIVEYFGQLSRPDRVLDNTYTEEPPQDGERSVVLRRVGSVAAVGAVYHVPAAAHADFAALEVLATALDMEPSGKLFRDLVESKKASSVNSVAFGWHDPGVLEVLAKVEKNEAPEAVLQALVTTLDEVRDKGISEAEVNRAKTKLKKARELQVTNSNRVGVTLSDWASKGDWRLFFVHRDRVAKVTTEDVKRVAALYLQPSNRTTGLFLPTKDPKRSAVPPTPDVAEIMKDYKGGEAMAQGETFDPTIENIRKRTEFTSLPSGTKAALLPRKTRGEVVNLHLALHYGNADSLKGQTTATTLLPQLMTRGTKKHTRQQLEDELDRLQARLTATGTPGEASFSIVCKRSNLPAVLSLLKEVLREPTLPADELAVLKRQNRSRLEEGRTEPIPLAMRAMQRKFSPYDKDDVRYVPTLDESVARLDAVNVEQLRRLYDEQLGGAHGELAVVGDFEPAAVVEQVGKALDGWKSETPYRRIERPAPEGLKGDKVVIETPDKANALYLAGLVMPLKDSDPESTALELGNFIFGGGSLSSRLGDRVRQKEGLSYGVGSQFHSDAQDPMGRFMIFAICNPKNIAKVDTAIAEELARMRKDGVQAKELEEAKKAFLAQLKQQRGTDAQLAMLLEQELYSGRGISYHADLEKQVGALTTEAVGSAFRRHIDPARLILIRAGDFKK